MTIEYQWKRIRAHISLKDENSQSLAPSASHSRRPSANTTTSSQRGRISASDNAQELDSPTRGPSPFSSYREGSPGRENGSTDDLGLHVVYKPSSPPPLDIIFVHGLGGASHKTWSKYQDPGLFWPQQWLPLEPDICKARILTFGYNARFRSGGPPNTNIADFAKDLLFGMKFGKSDATEDLGIGRVRTQCLLDVQLR